MGTRHPGRGPLRRIEKQKARLKNKLFQMHLYEVALIAPLGGAIYLLTFGVRFAGEVDIGPLVVVLGSVGLFLVAGLFHWINWRCPLCKKHLGQVWNPKKCPKCGAAYP